MNSVLTIRCVLAGLLGLSLVTMVRAQVARQIEVQATDEKGQPLSDAAIIVRSTPSSWANEEPEPNQVRKPAPTVLANTDANGKATVDVSKLATEDSRRAMTVTVVKSGYGPSSTAAQEKATLICLPVQKRQALIVDSKGDPIEGVKVEHLRAGEEEVDPQQMHWWKQDVAFTDKFGSVMFESPATGYPTMFLTDLNGVRHSFSLIDSDPTRRQSRDQRDLITVRLASYGKVEGQMPQEFSREFYVRLIRDFRAGERSPDRQTFVNAMPTLYETGRFSFDAVAEGDYWLNVYRRARFEGAEKPTATKQPVAFNKVHVESGQTAQVEVGLESLAKVSGRVVSKDANASYAGLRVTIGQLAPSTTQRRLASYQQVATAVCDADGSFTCWLPTGYYQASLVSTEQWKLSGPLEFEVGSGAATISIADLQIIPMKAVQVRWLSQFRPTRSTMNGLFRNVSFNFKDGQRVHCSLTGDGYGTAYLPVDGNLISITRDLIYSRPQEPSSFEDLDPSENFDLQLIKTPQGLSTNVTLRGRVVDDKGQPLGGIPVHISVAFEGGMTSSISGLSGGSQSLEIVWSETDGSYELPPRPLFRNVTIPGRSLDEEAEFTFTVSTPANPGPIEAKKVLKTKPSQWDAMEVELPELVIDRPLGGQRLSGKVLNASGEPSPGEVLRVEDKGHLVKVLSDSEGRFEVDDVAGPIWLLRSKDWSIHKLSDYQQPVTLALQADSVPAAQSAETSEGWRRLERRERLALAKELLKAVGDIKVPLRPNRNLPDEFYLEPDKYFQQLLLLTGADGDNARQQFVAFWTQLTDQQLQQLCDTMAFDYSRLHILRMIADRHPSPEAYQKVMEAIPAPTELKGEQGTARRMLEHLGAVGLKLHFYGLLDNHRNRIRQYLELEVPKRNNPMSRWDASELLFNGSDAADAPYLCRALLDPEQHIANVLEASPLDFTDVNREEFASQVKSAEMALRLAPALFDKLNARVGINLNDRMLSDFGEQAPLEALAAVKSGKLPLDSVRIISAAALASKRADGPQVFEECSKLLLKFEANSLRPRLTNFRARLPEVAWYNAASNTSPMFGKMVAWHLAQDYLNGVTNDSSISVLPLRNRAVQQTLATAYCLSSEYPLLAQEILQREMPRAVRAMESEFPLAYSRNLDCSLAAWLDPKTTVGALLKMAKQLEEDQKNLPAGRPDSRLFGRINSLGFLRDVCLKGLLLDEL